MRIHYGSSERNWLSAGIDIPRFAGQVLPTLLLVSGPEDGAGIFLKNGESESLRLLFPSGTSRSVVMDPIMEYLGLYSVDPSGFHSMGKAISEVLVCDADVQDNRDTYWSQMGRMIIEMALRILPIRYRQSLQVAEDVKDLPSWSALLVQTVRDIFSVRSGAASTPNKSALPDWWRIAAETDSELDTLLDSQVRCNAAQTAGCLFASSSMAVSFLSNGFPAKYTKPLLAPENLPENAFFSIDVQRVSKRALRLMMDLFSRYGFQILIPRLDRMNPDQRREVLQFLKDRGGNVEMICGSKRGLPEAEWNTLASSVSFEQTDRGDVLKLFASMALNTCPEGRGRLVHMNRESPECLDTDQMLILEDGDWVLTTGLAGERGMDLRILLRNLYQGSLENGESGDEEILFMRNLMRPEILSRTLEANRKVRRFLQEEDDGVGEEFLTSCEELALQEEAVEGVEIVENDAGPNDGDKQPSLLDGPFPRADFSALKLAMRQGHLLPGKGWTAGKTAEQIKAIQKQHEADHKGAQKRRRKIIPVSPEELTSMFPRSDEPSDS